MEYWWKISAKPRLMPARRFSSAMPIIIRYELVESWVGHILVCLRNSQIKGWTGNLSPVSIIDKRAQLDSLNHDKNVVIQKLRDAAIQDQCCVQVSVVERKICSYPKKETTVYAKATNLIGYGGSLPSSQLPLESKYNLAKRHEDMNATEVPMKKLKAH
ncbi:hypothetical protein HYC85_014483 [Camellia sinensis]|uniref:Uncharacterized protein n=1 Tax=Camellia sinensis TaxID=4442 RepID=A0A7J7H9T2_CAMSI|nr:hypothetical protein HYC85_014483 [Camellia sinensis]